MRDKQNTQGKVKGTSAVGLDGLGEDFLDGVLTLTRTWIAKWEGHQQGHGAPKPFTVFIVSRPFMGFPSGSAVKNPPHNTGGTRDTGSISGLVGFPGAGNDNILEPEKFHAQRSLLGYSLWGRKESDTTKHEATKLKMAD